jgi:hypothetical protein
MDAKYTQLQTVWCKKQTVFKIRAFWDVAPCSLVEVVRRLCGA